MLAMGMRLRPILPLTLFPTGATLICLERFVSSGTTSRADRRSGTAQVKVAAGFRRDTGAPFLSAA